MKVKKTEYAATHCISHCDDCDFAAEYGGSGAEFSSYRSVHEACKKHVRETGHTTRAEQALATKYEPEQAPQ